MIVSACSDTDVTPKPSWPTRKKAYLAHLAEEDVPESVLRVSLADKLHNLRAIVSDYRQLGDQLWERFTTRSVVDQLWYYRALAQVFDEQILGPAVEELSRALGEPERAIRGQRVVCEIGEIEDQQKLWTIGAGSMFVGQHAYGPCVYVTESSILSWLGDEGSGLGIPAGFAVAYCFESESARQTCMRVERWDRRIDGYLRGEMWELFRDSAPGEPSRGAFEIAYQDALDAIQQLPCEQCGTVAWPVITKPAGGSAEWLDDPSESFSCCECGFYLADPFAYPVIREPTRAYPHEGVVDRSELPPPGDLTS
jgi:hypothetical protein